MCSAFLYFVNALFRGGRFDRGGIINFYINQQWAEDNPYGGLQSRHQIQLSVNILAENVGDYFGDRHVLRRRLTGDHYRDPS
jgi:hypothetical protein